MEFFNSAVDTLQTIVVGLGGALCVWGGVNLLEGYGADNPASKSQGIKQLVAGGGVALIGMTLVPLLSGLLGLWFQTLVVGLTMNILSICIFLVTYGRMIEIYAVTALGPIPLATLGNAEWRGMGQNYLKSLLALGFQAFLIMVVVGIYAVLIQQIGTADDISGAIWGCMGYTVLLCFCLFKTGSISKAVFTAH